MSSVKNKIEASDKNINDLLKDEKFFIDYFQREYRWQEKHMVTLVEDLCNAFLKSHKPENMRSDVAQYQSYYLGPVVFSRADGKNSIIDGQQRITSITLFLIYLNNLQKDSVHQVNITNLIFSEKYGEKSFNMTDEDRQEVLKALYDEGFYNLKDDEQDETVVNIKERFDDIHAIFPEEIDDFALPYFIDWFIGNVILVKITAYSDENAYTIFETMNDRGMNLSSTEMLKGYVLSKIDDKVKRAEINDLWKEKMHALHEYDDAADLEFFKAWFRAKFAVTVRPRKADSENQDFEQISTRFHDWFKNNHEEKIGISTADDFYSFFKKEFAFMVDAYLYAWEKEVDFDEDVANLYYMQQWKIARSLEEPMILASLNSNDDKSIKNAKLNVIGRFIETYTVRRAINYKKFGASAIQYTFFNIIKSIRDLSLENLKDVLGTELANLDHTFEGVTRFGLHQQNGKFVKHLLCRITGYVDESTGKNTNYVSYQNPKGKRFEIEHLWANMFREHRDEFEQESDFAQARNLIGGLVLLPNGTNQSFSSDRYEDKLPHYLKENTYAQTLHQDFYLKNPNFRNSNLRDIDFKQHPQLKRDDILERTEVVQQLCEQIWSLDFFQNA